jgi:beta-galactosidase
VKDEHNVVTDMTLPGPLAELAGVAIHDFDPHTNQEQEVLGLDNSRYPASVWFDILDPTTATTLATYGKGYYAGKAAVTENTQGNGAVIYVGTESPSQEFYARLVARVAKKAGLALGPDRPHGVEIAVREKAGKKIVFVLNYTDQPASVPLDRSYRNTLTGEAEPKEVQVPPFDVKILNLP